METVLEILADHGVVLVEVDIPNLAALNAAVGFPVALYEAYNIDLPAYLDASAPGLSLAALIEQIASPDVKFVLETVAPTISPEAYEDALHARVDLQAAYAAYFADNTLDAVIFPTTLLPARPIGQDDTVDLNGEEVPTFPTYIHNTDPAGNAGIPGLSIPAGLTEEGLPVGIELDGPAGSDRRLLEIGLAVESVLERLPAPRPKLARALHRKME